MAEASESTASASSHPRTVETIQRELELLAQRHSHLLALGENAGTKRKKDRKKLLEARHASREFPKNDDNNDNDNDNDDYYLELFDEFARTVCHTGVIPRKELFECWAMALYVHFYFPPSPQDDEEEETTTDKQYYKRIADMGCGQGLVSWAILFLDKSRTRTAIGIDKKIPKSTDVIERVMKERHPEVAEFSNETEENEEEKKDEDSAVLLPTPNETETSTTGTNQHPPGLTATAAAPRKRWHWVEGDICKHISGDASTLVIGVHCCGTLSDTVLDLAIASRSALALVPCCHTRKSLPIHYQNNPGKVQELLAEDAKNRSASSGGNSSSHGMETTNVESSSTTIPPTTLTDYIDRCRMQKLADAGYDVQEERIPSVITPKNRIIVATPPPREDVLPGVEDHDAPSNTDGDDNATTAAVIGNQARQKYEKSKTVFAIPLADTPEARSIVESQSGRLAADLRLRRPPPNLSLSLYLPHAEAMTPETLNEFSNTIARQEQHKHYPAACNSAAAVTATSEEQIPSIIVTHVKYGSHGVYENPELGNFSRAYHICYEVNDPTGKLPQVTKAQAKALHKVVCDGIRDNALPGISLRQGLK